MLTNFQIFDKSLIFFIGLLELWLVSEVDLQTFMSEFTLHWAPYSYGLVPYPSKTLCKLLLEFWLSSFVCFINRSPSQIAVSFPRPVKFWLSNVVRLPHFWTIINILPWPSRIWIVQSCLPSLFRFLQQITFVLSRPARNLIVKCFCLYTQSFPWPAKNWLSYVVFIKLFIFLPWPEFWLSSVVCSITRSSIGSFKVSITTKIPIIQFC